MPIASPRAAAAGYVPPSVESPDEKDHRRQMAQAIGHLFNGKRNVTKLVTLTANAASTTISDSRIGATTVVTLIPITANGAAALPTTYQTYPNAMAEQAVINHANNALTDKSFVAVLDG